MKKANMKTKYHYLIDVDTSKIIHCGESSEEAFRGIAEFFVPEHHGCKTVGEIVKQAGSDAIFVVGPRRFRIEEVEAPAAQDKLADARAWNAAQYAAKEHNSEEARIIWEEVYQAVFRNEMRRLYRLYSVQA